MVDIRILWFIYILWVIYEYKIHLYVLGIINPYGLFFLMGSIHIDGSIKLSWLLYYSLNRFDILGNIKSSVSIIYFGLCIMRWIDFYLWLVYIALGHLYLMGGIISFDSMLWHGLYSIPWFNYSIWVILVSSVQLHVMVCIMNYDSILFIELYLNHMVQCWLMIYIFCVGSFLCVGYY